jgi:hypothetical protein
LKKFLRDAVAPRSLARAQHFHDAPELGRQERKRPKCLKQLRLQKSLSFAPPRGIANALLQEPFPSFLLAEAGFPDATDLLPVAGRHCDWLVLSDTAGFQSAYGTRQSLAADNPRLGESPGLDRFARHVAPLAASRHGGRILAPSVADRPIRGRAAADGRCTCARHSRAGGNPGVGRNYWIPACAGMTDSARGLILVAYAGLR